jgi:hypothetical protein
MGTVHFVDSTRRVDEQQGVSVLLEAGNISGLVRWDRGETLALEPRDMESRPEAEALFGELPDSINTARKLAALSKDFADYLYRNFTFTLFYNPTLKVYSQPGEDQRAFKIRCQQTAREQRDAEVDKLAAKYKTQIDRLQTRLRREEQEMAEDEADYEARKREELLSAGESILGFFMGRRRTTAVSSAARKRRMTSTAKQDILESQYQIEEMKKQLSQLDEDLKTESDEITARWAGTVDEIQEYQIKPRRTDVDVHLVALAWAPYWELSVEDNRGRPRTEVIAAY